MLGRLREHALGKKSSYQEVEKLLAARGVTTLAASTLQRYEKEGRVPDVLSLLGLADAYGVTPEYLFDALSMDLKGLELTPATADNVDGIAPILTDSLRDITRHPQHGGGGEYETRLSELEHRAQVGGIYEGAFKSIVAATRLALKNADDAIALAEVVEAGATESVGRADAGIDPGLALKGQPATKVK